MRRAHFEALRPRCPVCRAAELRIAGRARGDDDDLLEGILTCANDDCGREYPVIDGVPIIVAAIRAWLSANPLAVLARTDLSPDVESLIGDALGPGSPYDTMRQHAGMYAGDHYGDGSSATLVARGLALAGKLAPGPLLDLGCAAGGTTFALAEATRQLTIGVDLNFAMLRVASQALREGRVRFAKRRVGVVYDRIEIDVEAKSRELVDFWCCDAAALPFADRTFALVSALNLVDCVSSPREVVGEIARVTSDRALLSSPYDWTPNATPVEGWLGGHSQRAPHRGAAEPMLRWLVESSGMAIEAEDEHVPWRVRVHERSSVDYSVHVVAARRV